MAQQEVQLMVEATAFAMLSPLLSDVHFESSAQHGQLVQSACHYQRLFVTISFSMSSKQNKLHGP
jgi:hypothetical protein